MKNIVNETWGQLDYDEKQNRLFFSLGHATADQFKKLIDETVKAVKEHQPQDCIADVSKRVGSSEETLNYAIEHFKSSMTEGGLKRVAVVPPSNTEAFKYTEQFINRMENSSIRTFANNREAIHWLDSQSGLEKAA